jgi:hypothetical protein
VICFILAHGNFCPTSIDDLAKVFSFWNCVPLCVTSPPYVAARTYGINSAFGLADWLKYCEERFILCTKLITQSRGLNAWVIGHGKRTNYRWNAAPYHLAARVCHSVKLRDPIYYHRNGIPGSSGPDWFRQDVEVILCSQGHTGQLGYSNNTACGHPPKYGPGGAPSHRTKSGARVKARTYKPPKLSNPGNLLSLGSVGGGRLGHPLAHENEAPYPEQIPDFFIRSFSPENDWIFDPFMGSGTTLAVTHKLNRCGIGFDIRESQIDLTRRRLLDIGVKKSEIKVVKTFGALSRV